MFQIVSLVFIAILTAVPLPLNAQDPCPPGQAQDPTGKTAEKILSLLARQKAPGFDISARTSQNAFYIPETNTKEFLQRHPYAAFFPEPFFYKSDLSAAGNDREKAFLVGGVNCDHVIKSAKTLTGVPLETLSLRARGDSNNGQFAGFVTDLAKERPEWQGVGQIPFRSSGDGFLAREFIFQKGETPRDRAGSEPALRNLLVTDNQVVQKQSLTHQTVARPLLLGIESQVFRKDGDGPTYFEYLGKRYRVSSKTMGGIIDFLEGTDPKAFEKWKKKFPAGNLKDSGWTGRGVQGSFFNDELFSNMVYTFQRLDAAGKPEAEFVIDGLTPHMIHRYGFYQGGEYRKAPTDIVGFFNGMKDLKTPQAWDSCK